MKIALLGALVASLLLVGPAVTQGDNPPTALKVSQQLPAGCEAGLYSLKDYRRYASRTYKRKSVSKKAHARIARMERCQHSTWAKKMTLRYHKRYKRERVARQKEAAARARIAALTPFSCSFGRFAIPCSIVLCETRASPGSWTISNTSSGALGPYQFLGKRIPWPVRSEADKAAHHELAASLWAGGAGRGHWAQCL